MSKIIRYEAAGGVVVDGSQMLLLDRPERGEVRLPKGHIEAGESAASAALRETTEETGYDHLLIVADLGEQVVEFDYQGNHIIRREHFFLMRPVSHRQSPRTAVDEAQFRVRWTPLAEAVGLLSFAAEQEMARRALRELAEWKG
jgi:8-oxo-dGTP pyrophosphatase MutT (NUDIX family)